MTERTDCGPGELEAAVHQCVCVARMSLATRGIEMKDHGGRELEEGACPIHIILNSTLNHLISLVGRVVSVIGRR